MVLEKTEDLDNVYKLFGVCAHHCSNIEYRIASLLHPVQWKKHRATLDSKQQDTQKGDIEERVIAMKKFDEALEAVEQDINGLYNVSLGKLIKQVNEHYPLSQEHKDYLKGVLEKRNYVIHKMWGNYGRRLEDVKVVKEMLRELQELELYLRSASNWLQEQVK